ncbi:MAG: hypothetical protein LUQ40_04015 [Methanomicrobiales archaeon]|nr:hypothetical protein [Methanomicrobiales archaeon]
MERLNEEGQWIILMAFIISIGIFFLAIVINQSTVIGQTTAEGVLEFPKNDFQDLRSEVFNLSSIYDSSLTDPADRSRINQDIESIALLRKNAVVQYSISNPQIISGKTYVMVNLHYNNGVTSINETAYL